MGSRRERPRRWRRQRRRRSLALSVYLCAAALVTLSCTLAIHAAPVGNESATVDKPTSAPAMSGAPLTPSNDTSQAAEGEKGPVLELVPPSPAAELGGNSTSAGSEVAAAAGEKLKKKGKKSVTDIIKEARLNRGSLSGFSELVEWAIFFVLIAPGTFPAMSCVLLACTAFWRRHTRVFWNTQRPPESSPSIHIDEEALSGCPSTDADALRTRRRMNTPDDAGHVEQPLSMPLLDDAGRPS